MQDIMKEKNIWVEVCNDGCVFLEDIYKGTTGNSELCWDCEAKSGKGKMIVIVEDNVNKVK